MGQWVWRLLHESGTSVFVVENLTCAVTNKRNDVIVPVQVHDRRSGVTSGIVVPCVFHRVQTNVMGDMWVTLDAAGLLVVDIKAKGEAGVADKWTARFISGIV